MQRVNRLCFPPPIPFATTMKVQTAIVLSVLAGCGLGLASSFARLGFSKSKDLSVAQGATGSVTADAASTERPRVVVDNEKHDFGVVELGSVSRHAFQFKNVGTAALTLEKGATSCGRCTFAELTQDLLAPGESAEVIVEYSAANAESEFRQTAWINTNDPDRRSVMLTIEGRVAQSFKAIPSDLSFSRVSANETKTIEMRLLGFTNRPIEVMKHDFLEQESADHFQATVSPLPADEWKKEGATSGLLITVAVKPGLPLGPIRQRIRLETNLPRNSVQEVPITGTVVSDVEVFSPTGWNSDLNLLSIGPVKSKLGATKKLWILVRGPHRDEVQVKSAKIEPPLLKVTIGEPAASGDAPVVKIPLTIEVPKGAPAVNYLGTDANRAAEIDLETTHPDAKQIKLYVRFAVEN
jgi:hypothetical protein